MERQNWMMYLNIESYLNDIEELFIFSQIVLHYHVREKRITGNEGYTRIKAHLTNGDMFEAFEFVTMIDGKIDILTYRLQWQTSNGILKKRWDNAEHHRDITTFPHHVHDGVSGNVFPSEAMSLKKALEFIEKEKLATD